MREKLRAWKGISGEYGQRLILEGIEDFEDDEISNKLGINFRQGYYYGRSELFPLIGDSNEMKNV
ncbi:hypothetical protein FD33_GL002318 [Companilactobacillus paralimentarius DSM 13238 = JCM 10415]|uniref:EAL domain-containing protein n=1 Tax=Companilactobacillus paralimentarius DSM 13238 = JCM 10415 TaxID=1122151 RepID=A0A0R1PG83_9LACO|nr:hypothetical protein FD33_GL002318 [Companilactobacillus paralimentarius DSM 13238 = JCM 10415]